MRLAIAILLVAACAASARAEGEPAAGGPRIAFDRLEHDFGVVRQEQELTTEFKYRNEGDAPLKDLKTIADCGCYGVTLSKPEVAPGESATLKITFHTLLFTGPIHKKLSVKSNDPTKPDVTIRLHVLVGQGVVLDPGRVYFGDVLLGTVPSRSFAVKWLDGVGRPFEITAIEIPGRADDFKIETAPFEETQRLGEGKEGKWKGTKVTLTFTKPPPLGMFSSTALVRTDHPDFPRLVVALTASVSGKVWVQSRKAIFGMPMEGTTKQLTIAVRPFNKEVSLGTVKATVRGGKVEAKIERDPAMPEGNYRLVVSLPATAKPGSIDDVVEIHTEVKGEETVEIAVTGTVLPRVS